MPSLITDDEERFAVARKEPKLKDVSEEDLKKCLRYVYMVCGIRSHNIPKSPEKEFLHQYIRTHYGEHTASEVRHAFDMAIQGKLDCDARSFQDFSVHYFAQIMVAYRRWASIQAWTNERKSVMAGSMTAEEKKKIDEEYTDYLFNMAFRRVRELDKLPTTLKKLTQWRRENSRTK